MAADRDRAWDFGPVYDLLNNLLTPTTVGGESAGGDGRDAMRPKAERGKSSGLGDFSAVWDYLGVESDKRPVRNEEGGDGNAEGGMDKKDLTGTGGLRLDVESIPTTVSAGVAAKDFGSSEVAGRDVTSVPTAVTVELKKDYTSDGAVPSSRKLNGVAWAQSTDEDDEDVRMTDGEVVPMTDDEDIPMETDTTESEIPAETSTDDVTSEPQLQPNAPKPKKKTKAEKKAARKARQEKAEREGKISKTQSKAAKKATRKAAKLTSRQNFLYKSPGSKAVSDVEQGTAGNLEKKTPAGKASLHTVPDEGAMSSPLHRYPLRSRGPMLNEVIKLENTKNIKGCIAATPSAKSERHTKNNPVDMNGQMITQSAPRLPQAAPQDGTPTPAVKSTQQDIATKPVPPTFAVTPSNASLLMSQSARPGFPQYASIYSSMDPAVQASIQTPVPNATVRPKTPPQQIRPVPTRAPATMPAKSKLPTSLPKSIPFNLRHGEDRHLHFLLELIKKYPEDKKWLVAPMQLANHNHSAQGIHVFVDASNIFIGFKEYIRRSFNLPEGKQVKGLDISFDSLVLLMERRRPVSKRVIVGSHGTDQATFETAKSVGYETNLLGRVYKDKVLAQRQKFDYYDLRRSREEAAAHGYASGSGGELSETAAPFVAPLAGYASSPATLVATTATATGTARSQRWVEQGVDEIIHLKMLESLVDCDAPSTMVLATGDAAVAEYSQGFLKMVERALKKGWCVELMSWREGINKAYLKAGWRKTWGERFRVVELDEWVEDLVDS